LDGVARATHSAHARLRDQDPELHDSDKPASFADSRSHPGPLHHTGNTLAGTLAFTPARLSPAAGGGARVPEAGLHAGVSEHAVKRVRDPGKLKCFCEQARVLALTP
jgi:hypothetical protein